MTYRPHIVTALRWAAAVMLMVYIGFGVAAIIHQQSLVRHLYKHHPWPGSCDKPYNMTYEWFQQHGLEAPNCMQILTETHYAYFWFDWSSGKQFAIDSQYTMADLAGSATLLLIMAYPWGRRKKT